MDWNLLFFVNSFMLGIGLAMDAFSVSLADGLNEPEMSQGRSLYIASIFALFQFLMPMIGWICVHTVIQYFQSFEKCIPWIALILLCMIGGNMLFEGVKNKESKEKITRKKVSCGMLMMQGIATSIDALSVGFTIAEYGALQALVCGVIIGITTYFICLFGLHLGKKFGIKLADKAGVFGGVILILIGLEIFVTGIF